MQAVGRAAPLELKEGVQIISQHYWTPLSRCQATTSIEIPPTPANIVLDYNLRLGWVWEGGIGVGVFECGVCSVLGGCLEQWHITFPPRLYIYTRHLLLRKGLEICHD